MKTKSPSHEEISYRARELWQSRGNPTTTDNEIWLEAERQLKETPSQSATAASVGNLSPSAEKTTATTERRREDAASESMVENQISPPVSTEAAVKAALQKKAGREPKMPTKSAPKAMPPVSGKPIWDKPHSS